MTEEKYNEIALDISEDFDKRVLVSDIEKYHKVSMKEITQALTLQKLVKERIKDFQTPVYPNNHFDMAMINELQSLVKKSEK